MPEHAEIEAVEAILNRMIDAASRAGVDGTLPAERVRVECLRATYALDRVRDARGDDEDPETRREIEELKAELRSPQAEDHENCPDCWGGRPKWAGTMPVGPCPTCAGTGKIPWSPQREDHEVGIEAARQVLHGYVWHERLSDVTRATVAAYLSRVSPSRDGTVAVEDVERLQAAIDKAYGSMNASAYVGGPSEREAWQTALAALGEVVTQYKGQGEFGPARAGESDEGGNQ